jgi:hypothetical protein
MAADAPAPLALTQLGADRFLITLTYSGGGVETLEYSGGGRDDALDAVAGHVLDLADAPPRSPSLALRDADVARMLAHDPDARDEALRRLHSRRVAISAPSATAGSAPTSAAAAASPAPTLTLRAATPAASPLPPRHGPGSSSVQSSAGGSATSSFSAVDAGGSSHRGRSWLQPPPELAVVSAPGTLGGVLSAAASSTRPSPASSATTAAAAAGEAATAASSARAAADSGSALPALLTSSLLARLQTGAAADGSSAAPVSPPLSPSAQQAVFNEAMATAVTLQQAPARRFYAALPAAHPARAAADELSRLSTSQLLQLAADDPLGLVTLVTAACLVPTTATAAATIITASRQLMVSEVEGRAPPAAPSAASSAVAFAAPQRATGSAASLAPQRWPGGFDDGAKPQPDPRSGKRRRSASPPSQSSPSPSPSSSPPPSPRERRAARSHLEASTALTLKSGKGGSGAGASSGGKGAAASSSKAPGLAAATSSSASSLTPPLPWSKRPSSPLQPPRAFLTVSDGAVPRLPLTSDVLAVLNRCGMVLPLRCYSYLTSLGVIKPATGVALADKCYLCGREGYAGARAESAANKIWCHHCGVTAHRGCAQLVPIAVAVPVEGGSSRISGHGGSSAPATETIRLELIEPEDAWLCGECAAARLRDPASPLPFPLPVDVERERKSISSLRHSPRSDRDRESLTNVAVFGRGRGVDHVAGHFRVRARAWAPTPCNAQCEWFPP